MLPPLPLDYETRMPWCDEAQDLCSIGCDTSGRDALLIPSAAVAWVAMRESAKAARITLLAISAFRSIAQQREILEAKLASGISWAEILAVSAYPGFSEHHTGRAIDVGMVNGEEVTEEFENTEAFGWLSSNGQRFGFFLSYPKNNRFGIVYEPWHWCFEQISRH